MNYINLPACIFNKIKNKEMLEELLTGFINIIQPVKIYHRYQEYKNYCDFLYQYQDNLGLKVKKTETSYIEDIYGNYEKTTMEITITSDKQSTYLFYFNKYDDFDFDESYRTHRVGYIKSEENELQMLIQKKNQLLQELKEIEQQIESN